VDGGARRRGTVMVRPSVVLRVAAVIIAAGSIEAAAGPARAQAPDPTVTVSPASGAPGDRVHVDLTGWPDGPVNVSVCGNSARRGSQDCDQLTTEGVAVRQGQAPLLVQLSEPPIGCPCVVRATTPDNSLVRMAPVEIDGVPNVDPVAPAGIPPAGKAMAVTASVSTRDVNSLAWWRSVFGGAAERELTLTLQNVSKATLSGIRVVGGVGKHRNSAGPLPVVKVASLAPGASTRLRIPVELGAPAWGSYKVFGSVYGTSVPIDFSVQTRNDPWGLEVAAVLVLLLLAQVCRRRERERALADVSSWDRELGEPAFGGNSPGVGIPDGVSWPTPSYAAVTHPTVAAGVVASTFRSGSPPVAPHHESPTGGTRA
jgi:hypothetical protein